MAPPRGMRGLRKPYRNIPGADQCRRAGDAATEILYVSCAYEPTESKHAVRGQAPLWVSLEGIEGVGKTYLAGQSPPARLPVRAGQ